MSKQKRSLFQRLLDRNLSNEVFFNPSSLQLGSLISIDGPVALLGKSLIVKRIDSMERLIGGVSYISSDFYFNAEQGQKLRFNKETDGITCAFFVKEDSFGFAEDFLAILESGTPFEIRDDDVVVESFDPISPTSGYAASIKQLTDNNDDGKLQKTEVGTLEIRFWNFARESESEETILLLVELNELTGVFTIWRGEIASPNAVSLIG